MANFTITITNAINCFGPAPTTKWGTGTPYNMTWGTSKWGEGTEDLQVAFEKRVDNSLSLDSAVELASVFNLTIANTVDFSSDLSNEGISDGSGYSFLFPGNVSNAESRVSSTYSSAAAGNTTYSSATAGSTTWS